MPLLNICIDPLDGKPFIVRKRTEKSRKQIGSILVSHSTQLRKRCALWFGIFYILCNLGIRTVFPVSGIGGKGHPVHLRY